MARRGARILVLCAEVGNGHVTAARALTRSLRERGDVQAVAMRSDLEVMGPAFGRFMERGFRVHLDGGGGPHHLQGLSYELGYRVFFERALPRRGAHLVLAALGGRGLRKAIAAFAADLVVAEFPVLSAALGQLRAMGRLGIPVCSAISDPAGLWYWAHPGIDLHLLSWPESLAEVGRIAGCERAAVVRPLIDERFMAPPSREDARRILGLPREDPVVVVSGGGWGVGDLTGATEVVLATLPDATVVCLAGRSKAARRRVLDRHDRNPRVRTLAFTDRMPELLAGADMLIHTTGGTTALEARVVGCRVINFEAGVAHVRAHARAMADHGLAEWAPDRIRLSGAVSRALTLPAPAPLPVDGLPRAGDLILELVKRRAVESSAERGVRRSPAGHRQQRVPSLLDGAEDLGLPADAGQPQRVRDHGVG